jgi:transcriptional regulator with XRE-family HTH domain
MDLKIFALKNKISCNEMARLLGIKNTYLSQIFNGSYVPSKKIMTKIIDLTRSEIDANTFYKKELDKWKKYTTSTPTPSPSQSEEVV